MKWGMSDFESLEGDRPGFKGREIESYVDGSKLVFFPNKQRMPLFAVSAAVTGLSLIVVMLFVGIIFEMKGFVDTPGKEWQATYAPYINGVGITILNKVGTSVGSRKEWRVSHATEEGLSVVSITTNE